MILPGKRFQLDAVLRRAEDLLQDLIKSGRNVRQAARGSVRPRQTVQQMGHHLEGSGLLQHQLCGLVRLPVAEQRQMLQKNALECLRLLQEKQRGMIEQPQDIEGIAHLILKRPPQKFRGLQRVPFRMAPKRLRGKQHHAAGKPFIQLALHPQLHAAGLYTAAGGLGKARLGRPCGRAPGPSSRRPVRRAEQMTERIRRLRELTLKKEHHRFRQQNLVFEGKERAGTPEGALEGFVWALAHERPVFLDGERITLTRTVPVTPSRSGLWNDCLDYGGVIRQGLNAREARAREALRQNEEKGDLLAAREMACVLQAIAAIEAFTDRCARAAQESGNAELAGLWEGIPRRGAPSFREAVQFFRLLNFLVKADHDNISPLGRLDQILWPYLEQDLNAGTETEASALELLEELFLTLNRDADLYGGVQQGDNGQSIVLGGIGPDGRDSWNPVSDLCLQASSELAVIDPKINLRVCSTTPLERLVRATHLTAYAMLGLPDPLAVDERRSVQDPGVLFAEAGIPFRMM